MQIPATALKAYNDAIKAQGDKASEASRKVMEAYLAQNPSATVAEAREFAIYIVESAVNGYGNAAAQAACLFHDQLAGASGAEMPNASYGVVPDSESISKAARYQAGKLVDGEPEAFSKAIGEASRYHVERQANNAMLHAVGEDAKAGKRVRFARVPMGAETCSFCTMLASRGFVYHSRETAGEFDHYHKHCDCRIVPGYGDNPSAEGYDPDKYYDMWKHPEKYEDGPSIGNKISESGKGGSNNDYSVDLDYINSEKYRSKFKGLTGNSKVDDAVRRKCIAMLTHHNGDDREDLYLISLLDGETKGIQANSKSSLSVDICESIKNAVSGNPPNTLIGVHNHPSNIPPTGSDLVTAGVRKYAFGIVPLHDGTVYYYHVGDKVLFEMALNKRIEKFRTKYPDLSYKRAHELALDDLASDYGIEWREL